MQNIFNSYKNLSKEVYRLAIVRFILSMGNFIYPFLTLFLVKKLSIPPYSTSLFIIASGFTFVPASIISGKISDNAGRRVILLSSFLIYIVLIFFIFFLYHFNIIRNLIIAFLLIFANFFLMMTQVPITAIITDVTNPSNRNESFSLVYLATNVGFAFGPFIAGFLFENYTSLIFLGNAIFCLLGFLVLIKIKETKPDLPLNNQTEKTSYNNGIIKDEQINKNNIADNIYYSRKSAIEFIIKDKFFLIFTAATIFFSFAYSQAGFTLPIYLSNIFGKNGAKLYGILQSINALTVIFFTSIVSNLTKKKSAFLMVGLAGIFYALGFGLYGFFNSFYLYIFTTILWSIGEIIQITNQNVFIANRSPVHLRGRINGAFQIISGIGFVLGPVFSGFFQQYYKIKFIWPIIFTLSLSGFLLLFIIYKKNKDI
ncbi:MAG: MFS transporter [Exilispira sp.]